MSTGSIYTDPALPAARPGDGRFASAVLAPRGITVGSKRYQPLPAFSYFATSMPPPAMLRTAHYQQQPALRQVTLWLEPNDTALIASIISRYKALAESGDLPQQEWMLEAINSLFLSEGHIFSNHDDNDNDNGNDDTNGYHLPYCLPIRLCGERFEPDPASASQPRWEQPPILPAIPRSRRPEAPPAARKKQPLPRFTATSSSSNSVPPKLPLTGMVTPAPTLAYWLWAGSFPDPSTAHHPPSSPGTFTRSSSRPSGRILPDCLAGLTPLRHDRACLPYLSVDVLAQASLLPTGRERLAAAAATALWNRWRLWREAGGRGDGAAVRHFGVVVAGTAFEVWCARPTGDDTDDDDDGGPEEKEPCVWRGCRMSKVAGGSVVKRKQLVALVDWINEIHCWGNTVYAEACAKDVGTVRVDEETL